MTSDFFLYFIPDYKFNKLVWGKRSASKINKFNDDQNRKNITNKIVGTV